MTTPLPTWVCDASEIPDPHAHGERAVKFLKALKHPKSTAPGWAFQLAKLWERITRRVYGDTDENGKRRIRNVIILLPRGARKTSIGAAWALLHTFGPEKVPRGECLVAAADQKQAGIPYDEAYGIVEAPRHDDRESVLLIAVCSESAAPMIFTWSNANPGLRNRGSSHAFGPGLSTDEHLGLGVDFKHPNGLRTDGVVILDAMRRKPSTPDGMTEGHYCGG